LPGLPSNRWRTQEHKDNSPQGDRNNTRSGEGIGVVGEREEPGQLRAECRGSDRDRLEPDTNTMRDPQSTTNRSDSHAIRETSARPAKRRYRAHENVRYRRAKKVLVSPDQKQGLQPTKQTTTEPKLLFSLLHLLRGFLQRALDRLWARPRKASIVFGRLSIEKGLPSIDSF